MKKFVVVLLMVAVMVCVSARADVWTDYAEELEKVEQTVICESNGNVSLVVEFHDEGGHWIDVRSDGDDYSHAEMYVYCRGAEDAIYHASLTEDNADYYYELVTSMIFTGLL